MDFNTYQKLAKETRVYPEYGQGTIGAIAYCALGLAGEAGEVANKVKKLMRDGDTIERRAKICEEIGDCLWYAAMLLDEFGVSMECVPIENIQKLQNRKNDGKVKGEGDAR
jgi:NTP pyrophosphatase (non-canonical NTP hydrolase)